ncbi:MAG: HD domain-containing protein, partial [Anaeroplasmataceae bacterium]
LDDLTKNEDLIICGLLHDVQEDCDVTNDEIKSLFGDKVASIVDELTTPEFDKTIMTKQTVLLAKMVNMSEDAFTVKLTDRLDNVQYLNTDCTTRDEQAFIKKYFEETVFLMKELQKLRKDRTKLHNAIIRMIEAHLDYIRIKFLW